MKKIVFLFTLTFLNACEFRMKDEVAKEALEPIVDIKFGDLLIGKQNIHYAYTDQERNQLIVFIHGSPGSWNAFIDYFKADTLLDDFDMISIDRPGFGRSGFGEAEASIEQQAYYMHKTLRQFPHRHKILIGHSLGGPVVARMAMDYKDSYFGMVMIAPSIDPEMEKGEWYREAIDTQIGAFLTPKEFEVSNEEILPLKGELEKMILFWKEIKIPTIIIHGTDDSLVPIENVAFAERMMADSVLEVNLLKGVNHFIPWSHPEEIVKAIRQLAGGQ